MVDIRIKEKIEELKNLFRGEDVHEDAKKQIIEWEKEILQLSQIEEFVNQPVVSKIVLTLKNRIKTYMLERVSTGKTNEDLKIIDVKELEVRYLLSLLQPRYQDALQTLEQIIDAEL